MRGRFLHIDFLERKGRRLLEHGKVVHRVFSALASVALGGVCRVPPL